MDIFLNLNTVSLQHNLKGLRHLFDLVESHVRGLKSLGVPPESYGSLMSYVLMNKLPSEFSLIISRDVKGDEWDINTLMQVMEHEIDPRERAAMSPSLLLKRSDKDQLIAMALLTGESGLTCSYCNQSRSSSTCIMVTNVETRKQILKKTGRCFVWLRRHHINNDSSIHSEFTNSVSFNDNRYDVCIPWRESHPVLPDNYGLSHRQLTSLLKQLKHDPPTLQAYNDVIQGQLTQGIVDVVDNLNLEMLVRFIINVDMTTGDESYTKSVLGGRSDPCCEEQKILGVHWNFIFNQLVSDLTDIAATLEPTKRNIVGLSGKFYHPLGLVSPFTVQFKLFFKTLCEARLEWDEPFSEELLEIWSLLVT